MPSIRGAIFDLGSTLIRFRGDWDEVLNQGRAAMVAWLRQAGYPLQPTEFDSAVNRLSGQLPRPPPGSPRTPLARHPAGGARCSRRVLGGGG
jgi:hypothetical protein